MSQSEERDANTDEGPASPDSFDESPGSSDQVDYSLPSRRLPSLRTMSDPQASPTAQMSSTSTVTGTLNNARRPTPSAGNLPLDLMQRARALQQERMAMSKQQPGGAGSPLPNGSRHGPPGIGVGGSLAAGGMAPNLRLPPHLNRNMGMGGMSRPAPPGFLQSAPAVPSVSGRSGGLSLSERRAMKLGPLPGSPVGPSPGRANHPKLSDMGGAECGPGHPQLNKSQQNSKMDDFKHYIDAEKGWITFEGAATITRTGVNFAGGHTFKISLDEIQVIEELGKGNYGTVYMVRHARPPVPRFGPGLSGFKTRHVPQTNTALPPLAYPPGSLASRPSNAEAAVADGRTPVDSGTVKDKATTTTGKVMAMKEIRLELDEAKFTTILKELVILHECVSPYIIDFYGAFYQEGAVYMCIEYMDGGSIDKLYSGGIPENVLRKIAYSAVRGLKTLKDEHNIIHRDVKPTNILANTAGHVKICDFGVSGNLVASIAKTNIGCQSYMAPERISGGGMSQASGANTEGTYSVQSDIWSLGLTIIECALGRYPYPPEVSSTIFGQLSAIVNGEPPSMPANYSATAHDFVRSCLNKNPMKRHTYAMLLDHAWLRDLTELDKSHASPSSEAKSKDGEVTDVTTQMDKTTLSDNTPGNPDAASIAGDAEVAAWVSSVLEKKHSASTATSGNSTSKPALHAAPLAP